MWDRVYQLSESYAHISPYVYCLGNPTILRDEQGLYATEEDAIDAYKKRGFDQSLMNKSIYECKGQEEGKGWFIALNETGDGVYASGGAMTREFSPLDAFALGVNALASDFAVKNDIADIYAMRQSKTGIIDYSKRSTEILNKVYDKGNVGTVSKYIGASKAIGTSLTAIGTVGTVVAIAYDIRDGHYYTAATRFTVGVIVTGVSSVPGLTFVGVGLGFLETTYGERLYNYMRNNFDNK